MTQRINHWPPYGLILLCCLLSLPLGGLYAQSTTARVINPKNQIIAPARRDVPGQRFSLSTGHVYVPEFFKPSSNGQYDLVVFCHGAAWCSEQNFYDARKNAVLLSVSLTDYQTAFSDTTLLNRLINETQYTLQTVQIIAKPKLRKLVLASFSGGYSAIREILKSKDYFNKTTDLILGDSLYCPFTDTTRTVLDEQQMKPFLDYAIAAAKGKKNLWFTQLYPPEEIYRTNTTTITAQYLIEHTQTAKIPCSEKNALGMEKLYKADNHGLHIYGYAGMYNQDHFNHLYNMAEYYKKTSLANVK
jgi:hypothetical protein